MRVSLSGKQFVFPRECACCGSYPLTSISVSGTEKNRRARTKGWVWEIPYCQNCKRHVRLADGILMTGLGLLALSFVSSALVTAASRSLGSGVLTLTLSASSSLLTGLIGWLIARRRQNPNCCGLTRAALYIGSAGSCHTFDFKSGFYAAEFVRANHRKIVNASLTVASILGNTRFGDFQVARRLIRRR